MSQKRSSSHPPIPHAGDGNSATSGRPSLVMSSPRPNGAGRAEGQASPAQRRRVPLTNREVEGSMAMAAEPEARSIRLR